MTIRNLESSYIRDLDALSDVFLQYEYLVCLGNESPRLADEMKNERTRIPGCETGMWLVLRENGGRIEVEADSNALLMRGILSILTDLLSGRTPEEICAYEPRYVQCAGVRSQISADRFRGFQMLLRRVQDFASSYLEQAADE